MPNPTKKNLENCHASGTDPRKSAIAPNMVSASGRQVLSMRTDLVRRCVSRSAHMFLLRFVACAAAFMVVGQTVATADPLSPRKSNYLRVHGQALPPFGFVHFCRRHHEECGQPANVSMARFDASPAWQRQLDAINRQINARIKPKTDLALYGREEYWTFPVTEGDCEDYVVLKRRTLMQQGWPANALLITVVLDEQGDGHAVLTVRTKQGDYVLDNKVNDVRLWDQTPYKFLMRQSYLNPKLWMALDPRLQSGAPNVAGLTSTN